MGLFIASMLLVVALGWMVPVGPTILAAADDTGVITGIVTSVNGPEAGVWVIAETDDLETMFRKIVVTNDDGRFLLPELPDVTYHVWLRGYGLVDSNPTAGTPGQNLALRATVAPTPQAAAQVDPGNYWLSLIDLPDASEFPGTGPEGNGINPRLRTLSEWVNNLKGCQRCHQLGSLITRDIPDLDEFDATIAAWDHRLQRGQRGRLMNSFMTGFGRDRGLQMFADCKLHMLTLLARRRAVTRPTGLP